MIAAIANYLKQFSIGFQLKKYIRFYNNTFSLVPNAAFGIEIYYETHETHATEFESSH